MSAAKGPVLIELQDEPEQGPQNAPPPPDLTESSAIRQLAVTKRPAGRLARWFWRLLAAILVFAFSLWAWGLVTSTVAANPVLGYAVTVVLGAFVLVSLLIILREFAAIARLKKLDGLREEAEHALETDDLAAARRMIAGLERLYTGRGQVAWGLARLKEQEAEQLDAESLLSLAETTLMANLDTAARLEVEVAARRVATVTALVPVMLADVVAVLFSNLRMIRRIAEIYGGRSGLVGSWRITRNVLAHLVATGAVAVGDDLIGSLAGGGILSKVSRRFGEGVVNGALTARVGVATMQVCRPLPFRQIQRPKVRNLIANALTGLFGQTGTSE